MSSDEDSVSSLSQQDDIYSVDDESASSSSSNENNQEVIILSDNDESSDDEFEVDDFIDAHVDELYNMDIDHVYADREQGAYYIGVYKYMKNPQILLMINSISARIMYKFSFHTIMNYFYNYSSVRLIKPKPEIMKLCVLEDDTYSVILKTHWLRIVQRHWKKIFLERKKIIQLRKSPRNIIYREVHGKFPYPAGHLPLYQGMLSIYSNI
jgi:hypothetical protein